MPSNSLAVAASSPSLNLAAKELATDLQLPFYAFKPPLKFATDYEYLLMLGIDGLAIAKTGKGAPNPVMVDFTTGAADHRRRFGGGKGQDIAKAVGLNKRTSLHVIDGTAGLGRDSFVFATLGCKVQMFERVPFVSALLRDGLERAAVHMEVMDIIENMDLTSGSIMDLEASECCDVVYLDPMFPHNDKATAAAKKEMAFFRDLVGADLDSDKLLPQAMSLARFRVVVKRPKGAPDLNNAEPTYRLEGKSGRFDIYVKRSLDNSD